LKDNVLAAIIAAVLAASNRAKPAKDTPQQQPGEQGWLI